MKITPRLLCSCQSAENLQKQILFRKTVSRLARQLTYYSILAEFRQAIFEVFSRFFSEISEKFPVCPYIRTVAETGTRYWRRTARSPAFPPAIFCGIRFARPQAMPTGALFHIVCRGFAAAPRFWRRTHSEGVPQIHAVMRFPRPFRRPWPPSSPRGSDRRPPRAPRRRAAPR